MKTSLAVVLTIITLSNALELPNALKPCRKSNPEYGKCMDKVIQNLFVKFVGPGDKSFNLPPSDPLAVDLMESGATDKPISIKQTYRNMKLHGLSKNLEISNSRMDFDKLIFYSESRNAMISFVGDYEVEGKMLFIPLKGAGFTNITMINHYAENTITFEKYVQDGETYLRATDYKLRFKPERVIMRFDNLFSNYDALEDSVRAVFDDNTDLIFTELQGPVEVAFGLIYKNIANKILTRFPMKTLFPE